MYVYHYLELSNLVQQFFNLIKLFSKMKKSIFSYFSYLVLLLLAVGTLSSCDTTETVDAAPTITISPASATIDVGQTAEFTYSVFSDQNLEEIRVISRNTTQQTITGSDFTNNKSHSGSFSFVGAAPDAGTTITVTVEAVDKDGNRSSQSADIMINEQVDPISIEQFPAILLGAQANANTGSFLDANTGTVYKYAEAKENAAKVDMAYLQGSQSNGQGAVIGAPTDNSIEFEYNSAVNGVQTWSTRNATRFKDTALGQDAFNAITDGSELTAAFAAGTEPNNNGTSNEGSKSRVNQLTAGKVFAFRTADGKDGLAYVVSVEEGTAGSIRLDIKVVR